MGNRIENITIMTFIHTLRKLRIEMHNSHTEMQLGKEELVLWLLPNKSH